MPRLTNSNPRYCRHRASGQAVVTIEGRDIYLGPYGTKASKSEYDRIIGEWLANGRRIPRGADAGDLTVAEVIVRFWDHAQTYYRKPDGTPTTEVHTFKSALKPLKRLYGRTPARDFGPLAMEAVRKDMIAMDWSRRHVNGQIARLKHVFKWAVSRELVPASVHHALVTVAGLKAGRSEARESKPVKPVPDAMVQATLREVSRTIAAMIKLQLFTGARPGEICLLRSGDIDRAGDVWVYRPAQHKTEHHGHDRTIYIGKRGQDVLIPFLKLDPHAYCFSPIDAERDRLATLHAARKTPLSCGNRPGTNRRRRPQHQPGACYDTDAYRRAIERGCDAAFPPPEPLGRREGETIATWQARLTPEEKTALRTWNRSHRWHPHQLRHTAATEIRKRFGIEAAQHVLGHSTLNVTEIYAEKNAEAARRIAAEVG
jgi:integrase